MQAAAQLQRQLRQQEFELYSPNPRMLPAEHHPRKLVADILPESLPMEQLQNGRKRRAPAKGRAAAAKKSKKAIGTKISEGCAEPCWITPFRSELIGTCKL